MRQHAECQRLAIVESLDDQVIGIAMQAKTFARIEVSTGRVTFMRFDVKSGKLDVAAFEGLDRAMRIVVDGGVENLPSEAVAIGRNIAAASGKTETQWGAGPVFLHMWAVVNKGQLRHQADTSRRWESRMDCQS